MVVTAKGAGVPASAIRRYGWALDANGNGYTSEVGAAAVAVTERRFRGIAFTADDAMYTTNTAPAATAIQVDGFAVRLDGAVHVNTGAVSGNNGKGGCLRDTTLRVFA
jgi:hypothetical protein